MPFVNMLVGLPGAGKSTWIRTHYAFPPNSVLDIGGTTTLVSTDYWIEKIAVEKGLTYNEVFSSSIKHATLMMENTAKNAIINEYNVLWDQTNLTSKNRAKKLKPFIDAKYTINAIVFLTPVDHEARLASRPGKIIPPNVIKSMIGSYEMPSKSEGFKDIIFI